MRIVVFSDSHGNFYKLRQAAERHLDDADLFLHLGDGLKEFADLQALYPEKHYLCVQGNCDFGSSAKLALVFACAGQTIFATHGNIYNVKSTLTALKKVAIHHHASIALYGHSHKNFTGYDNGLYLMNPGSLARPRDSKPSYGVLDITPAGVVAHIVEVNPR